MSVGGGGGDKPEKVKVSEGEKIQTQLAKDQYAYYNSTYAPLAKNMADASNQSFAGRFDGQASGAAMREGTGTLSAIASTGSMMDSNTLAGQVTKAGMAGRHAGMTDQADRRFEALGVGLGATADASRSLSAAGGIQTAAAIQNTRDAMEESNSKAQTKNALYGALGSVAGAAGTYYGMDYMANKQEPKTLTQITNNKKFSSIRGGKSHSGASL